MTELSQYKHRTPVFVRFKDSDMMGHVNNANILTYAETARIDYFHDVLLKGNEWEMQDGIILARIEANYVKPLRFKDKIAVLCRCSRIGNKSFDLDWAIVKDVVSPGKDDIHAYGTSTLVCYDYNKEESIPVSTDKRKLIEEYEGTNGTI